MSMINKIDEKVAQWDITRVSHFFGSIFFAIFIGYCFFLSANFFGGKILFFLLVILFRST